MATETILIIILLLLAANLFLVGVYLALVLKDFRSTLQRVNYLLDTMTEVTDAVADPVVSFSEMASGVANGLRAWRGLDFLRKLWLPPADGSAADEHSEEEVYDE